MGSFNGKPSTEKISAAGERDNIRFGRSSMRGWRVAMEDSLSLEPYLAPPFADWLFFAVFDGHGGRMVSETSSTDLLKCILETEELKEIIKMDKFDEFKIINGIKKGFSILDKRFVNVPGGTTVSAVFITPNYFIFVNCGDSRGLLIRSSEVYFATTDHKPTQPVESERIIKAGGEIIVHRLNGNLSVSRALGDSQYKGDSQLSINEQLISSEPDVYIFSRNNECDQVIILACDGIWDVFTNEEMMKLVLQRCTCNNDLGKISEELIDTALHKGSKDNISIIIITFENAPKIDCNIQSLDQKLDEEITNKTIDFLYSEASDLSLTNLIEYMKRTYFENLPPGGIETKQSICVALFEKYISSKYHGSIEFKPKLRSDQTTHSFNDV